MVVTQGQRSRSVSVANPRHSRMLARRSVRKSLVLAGELCSAEQFRALVDYERMRADRSDLPFAVLLFRLRRPGDVSHDAAALARICDRRLRLTDEVGWWDTRAVAALLPDTTVDGARCVADDVMHLAGTQIPLGCEVYVYPTASLPPTENEKGLPDRRAPAETVAPAETGAASIGVSTEAEPARRVRRMEDVLVRTMPWWKRGMDIVGALAGLLLLGPLMLAAAAAIKLTSRGPVFFRQRRDGQGGRRFWMYKFRTMVAGADARQGELRGRNEQDGPAFKLKNDPRVTWIGRYLRRTCIDELPQLWHVLRGEMSLVGPRPLDSDEAASCQRWQRRRLDVRPGLTCIWQVYGKSNVPFNEWMRMDIRYMQSHSLCQDVKLILATLVAVVLHRGSH